MPWAWSSDFLMIIGNIIWLIVNLTRSIHIVLILQFLVQGNCQNWFFNRFVEVFLILIVVFVPILAREITRWRDISLIQIILQPISYLSILLVLIIQILLFLKKWSIAVVAIRLIRYLINCMVFLQIVHDIHLSVSCFVIIQWPSRTLYIFFKIGFIRLIKYIRYLILEVKFVKFLWLIILWRGLYLFDFVGLIACVLFLMSARIFLL